MTFEDFIERVYAPKGEGADDCWMGGLNNTNGNRLLEHLGEESKVCKDIQLAGDYLFRARKAIQDLKLAETTTENDIPTVLADEICEAMSCFCRMPTMRFFNSLLSLHPIVTECIRKRSPEKYSELPWTDAQYHGVVAYCLCCQVSYTQSKDEKVLEEVIRAMEACLKARPDDASMHCIYGNFLMVNGFSQDARERYEKAIELDEQGSLNAHYSLANMMGNLMTSADDYARLNPMERLQAQVFSESCREHLGHYLNLAPRGHWHIHRACMLLISKNVLMTAQGTESIDSIERRVPGFCEQNHKLFERSVEALRLYNKCFGRESSDFKHMYRQAAGVMTSIHQLGLANGRIMPDCEFVCGNPICMKDDFAAASDNDDEDQMMPLQTCSRCNSIRYCSRPCQIQHWKMKNGHKKDCKRMKEEREEQQKIPKQRLCKDPNPGFGKN